MSRPHLTTPSVALSCAPMKTALAWFGLLAVIWTGGCGRSSPRGVTREVLCDMEGVTVIIGGIYPWQVSISPSGAHVAILTASAASLPTSEATVEYIRAGDCYQVNLSQRLLAPLREHPLDLYGRLRQLNPAPFSAYFDMGDFQILSTSPERFLKVEK